MIAAGDSNVAVQQSIEVFQTNFYYAPSPDGWSLIEGDGNALWTQGLLLRRAATAARRGAPWRPAARAPS